MGGEAVLDVFALPVRGDVRGTRVRMDVEVGEVKWGAS